jgi:fluoride exporter
MNILLSVSALWVAIGGAIGSVARFWISLIAVRVWGDQFPWGTIVINIGGSLVIGLFGSLTAREGAMPASDEMRAFVMIGICGGFTTFSSFSLQTLLLLRAGQIGSALANILISVLLCLVAVALGAWLAGLLQSGPATG